MAEPLDMLLEMAWKRYDESNQERRDIGVTSSILLAVNGVLLGLCIQNISNSLWMYFAIAAILISVLLAVMVFIGQSYYAFDTMALWNEIRLDESVLTKDDFQARIISSICAIEKSNTHRTQRLWLPLSGSIAELVSAVLFLSFSLL